MEIQVENIKCHGCANSITGSLKKMHGVQDVNVNVENGTIAIDGKEEELNRDEIIAKLRSMGYPEPGKGSGLTTATSYVSCMIGRVKA